MSSSASASLGYGFYVKEDEEIDTEDWPMATEHLEITFAGNLYYESYSVVLVKASYRNVYYGADQIELPDDNHTLWDIWLDEFINEFKINREAITSHAWILAASYG